VVPVTTANDAVREILERIARSGQGSFLVVLKTFGARLSRGLLSFPQEGTTLALDFPHRGASTLKLLESLDAVTEAAGGRIYAAKDGRVSADRFRRYYPRIDEFTRHVDPAFSSTFWRRVGGGSQPGHAALPP
jgi:L-gulonolactone oxidase